MHAINDLLTKTRRVFIERVAMATYCIVADLRRDRKSAQTGKRVGFQQFPNKLSQMKCDSFNLTQTNIFESYTSSPEKCFSIN